MGRINGIRVLEYKSARLIVVCVLSTFVLPGKVSANIEIVESGNNSPLQIYLPREVSIKGSIIKLGQVSIIRGADSLIAKAAETALGKITVPGQQIIIDRPLLLSRLACDGFPASKVELSGAEKITVKRQEQVIEGSEFVELAREFLKENFTDNVCQMDPVLIPKDLIIPKEDGEVKLVPCLVRGSSANLVNIQIVASQYDKQIGIREVTFRLKYNSRKAVTTVDISAGTVISPENVKIENTISNYPEQDEWRPPYGLIAKRRLAANTVVRPNMLSSAKSEVIVKRNQNVVIRVERPGLMVTAIGKALQDASNGEYIKVRNIDSNRIILARVSEDRTVEPVF
jgi:flagella basal body P-ring formation protein FlgA